MYFCLIHLLQELYTGNTVFIQSYTITPVLLLWPVEACSLFHPGLASLYAHPQRISEVFVDGMTTVNFYIQFSVECHGMEHAYGVTACITGISSVYEFTSVMTLMLQYGTAKRMTLVSCY